MQFNITTDYAIRTVLFLAIKNKKATSKEIAEAMGIPIFYLFKITTKLIKAGIIMPFVGVNGGFDLCRKIQNITLFDIVNAIEPTMRINRCLEDDEYCSRFATKDCPVRKFYVGMQQDVEQRLKSITVAYLLGK